MTGGALQPDFEGLNEMEFLGTLNFWLWVAQGLLAAAYLMVGIMKTTRPIADLDKTMKWPGQYPRLVRFIGAAEFLGAVGLVAPMVTGILVWLTPLAAIALSVVQVLAIAFHARRGESQTFIANVILLALSVFIAWGRFGLFGA